MNEWSFLWCIFALMFFFHEWGHVIYAKHCCIYKRLKLFRISHLSSKFPKTGVCSLPIGFGVETDLTTETLKQRSLNCLFGIFAGLLPFVLIHVLTGVTAVIGVVLLFTYSVCCVVDIATIVELTIKGHKRGFNTKIIDII